MKRRALVWLVAGACAALAVPAVAADAESEDVLADYEIEHGGEEHGSAEHGGHDAHEDPHINWVHGFLGEKEGAEPDFLYRPIGMPPPLLAQFVNAGLLFYLLFAVGRKPLAEALKKRKERIVSGMEEAGKMRAEAAEALEKYEDKLKHIEEEIQRVRDEMKATADAERERILAEAKERRARMERDAKLLIEQELKAARELLVNEMVEGALRSAEEMITRELTPADEERIAKASMDLLGATKINAGGGRA